jgi:CcmD family protein
MRLFILIAFVLVPHLAFAQPSQPAPVSPAEAAALRKTCADAMNANAGFAESIVETINADTAKQHRTAADAIAKNEKHVFMAYAAMWVIAAGFLFFMWRRQQGLKNEIAQLKRDLEAAAK